MYRNSSRTAQSLSTRAIALAAIVTVTGLTFSASAASNTWATGSGNWIDAANWTGGVNVPGDVGTTTSTDVATFGSTGTGGTVTVDATRNVAQVVYGTHAYTLSGGPLILTGVPAVNGLSGSSGSLVVNSDVRIEAATGFTGSGGGIVINGNVSGNAAAATNYALTLAGSSTSNKFNGVISDGTGGGTLSLTVDSSNAWELPTANTYTGGTTVGTGSGIDRVLVSHADAFSTGTVAIASGASNGSYGQLQLKGGIALTPGSSNQISIASGAAHTISSTSGHIVNISENNSYAGNVRSSGHLYLASRAGKLTLSGEVTSSYTSGVAGTTRILSISGDGDGEISGKISHTLDSPSRGWFTVTKDGAGTWTFSNPATTGNARNGRFGSMTINAGALLINADNSRTTDAAVTTTVNTGATFGGSGIIGGGSTAVKSGGILSPGATASVADLLTFNSNLTQETGSNFNWQLFGNTSSGRGDNYDGIDFTGTRTLEIQTGVTANLSFNTAGSTVDFNSAFWDNSQTWQISSGAATATLASAAIFDTTTLTLDSLGNNFSVTGGTLSFSQVGQDVFLNYVVPEPASLSVLALGGLGLLSRRLRRR